MVDVFPTLAQLAGLPEPQKIPGSEGINGTSLVPALLDPANATYMKPAAFSQFSKNNAPGDGGAGGTSVACTFFRNATKLMGCQLRSILVKTQRLTAALFLQAVIQRSR
jgi:hypothetical protein